LRRADCPGLQVVYRLLILRRRVLSACCFFPAGFSSFLLACRGDGPDFADRHFSSYHKT
jgi:hypothetical protein